MKHGSESRSGQEEVTQNAEEFRSMVRELARQALLKVFAHEVEELCGPRHHPLEDNEFYRSGGVDSPLYLEGRPEKLRRARVRRRLEDGGSQEVALESWKLAQDPEEWEEAMMRAILCGVSTRKVAALRESEVRGESHSTLSRLWQKKAQALVEEIQTRDLSEIDLLVLMIDGVVLCSGLVATVAMGIDTEGSKHLLGFRIGSSENEEVCADLLVDLRERGLRVGASVGRMLLAVLDGSKALDKAVNRVLPDSLIQRCLVHKERNIRGYLSSKDWARLAELFKALRESQGAQAGKEAAEAMEGFLREKNAQALESFLEAGESLLTLFRLGVPNTLHPSLLSTNAIENAFKNLRRHIGRVCRWREETNQAELWVASGLKLAAQGFRRIRGCRELPGLVRALEEKWEEKQMLAKVGA